MDDLYEQMITCLNQKIACLSLQEKAAIFAWLKTLTGDQSVAGKDQHLGGRMKTWFEQFGFMEGMMWYRIILNRCEGDRILTTFSRPDSESI